MWSLFQQEDSFSSQQSKNVKVWKWNCESESVIRIRTFIGVVSLPTRGQFFSQQSNNVKVKVWKWNCERESVIVKVWLESEHSLVWSLFQQEATFSRNNPTMWKVLANFGNLMSWIFKTGLAQLEKQPKLNWRAIIETFVKVFKQSLYRICSYTEVLFWFNGCIVPLYAPFHFQSGQWPYQQPAI